jgi:GTPase SAR1 family protein
MSMGNNAARDRSVDFHLAVIGAGPVGKTSLINALLRRTVAETGATIGTTCGSQSHSYVIEGMEGTLLLTDTVGLGGAESQGPGTELSAIDTAPRADLLVFVVDHDLTRAECQAILDLTRQGKRLIVALNKKDRFTDEDREAVMAKLRERLVNFVLSDDIVAVAAAPAPFQVRARRHDGTTETVLENDPPDLQALEFRIAAVLEREGDALRAGNILLRARRREQAERKEHTRQRQALAAAVIDRHQWFTAVTAFANPVLALGPMVVGALQLRMLTEMAAIYDVQHSADFVESVGRQMPRTLLRLGLAEAVASILAGLFKFNPIGFAAGGLVQAVTMAYLTRLTGVSFAEYLEHGQDWGEGGMQAMLSRRLRESSRTEWLMQFAKMAIQCLFRR